MAVIGLSCGFGGCAIMPDLPPDWALPMQEIVLHTACELQGALRGLNGRVNPKQFDANGWTIKITLNPKVDADIQPGAGLTRRIPTTPNVPRFSNFVIGSGNGATADMRGNRTGSVDFKFDSAALIKNENLPCDAEKPSYHSLTKYLAIREWLFRAADAMILTGSSIDNPSFSADVIIKFSGTGSWTYTFPPGTDLLSLSGYYQLEEVLNINFTAKAKVDKFQVVTLPVGGPGADHTNNARPVVPSTVTILEDQQSSLQQIRQQLQNLRPPVTQ
jgi:hypothetical protein